MGNQDQVQNRPVLHYNLTSLLVVEFVEVLHISEDDVLFVDDPWWNLLNATGHLPQIRLHRERRRQNRHLWGSFFSPLCVKSQQLPHLHPYTPSGLARTPSLSESALPWWIWRCTNRRRKSDPHLLYTSVNLYKLSENEVKSYSFLRADLRFSSFNSWAASRSLTSDPGAVAGMMSNWRSLLCTREV